MREPMVLEEHDAEHIEELLETLADGYFINSPTEERQEAYQAMHERFKQARP